jgi:hypothetical protein
MVYYSLGRPSNYIERKTNIYSGGRDIIIPNGPMIPYKPFSYKNSLSDLERSGYSG